MSVGNLTENKEQLQLLNPFAFKYKAVEAVISVTASLFKAIEALLEHPPASKYKDPYIYSHRGDAENGKA